MVLCFFHFFKDIPILNSTFSQNYTLVEDDSQNATWLCKVEGNPVGRISWLLNGSIIPSNGFEISETIISNKSNGVIIQSELKMIGITRHKAGMLVCNASNDAGFELSKAIVIVHCKFIVGIFHFLLALPIFEHIIFCV